MLKGRHIVLVLKSFRLGGAERQALHLARYFQEHEGAQVCIVGLSSPDAEVPAECDYLGIRYEYAPFHLHGKLYKLAPALLGLLFRLRRLRPHVLIPFLDVANIACGLLWPFVGARASIWNQRDQGWSWKERPFMRQAIRRTSHFVANSSGGADFLIASGVSPDRIRVISNAVRLEPPQEPPETWRSRLGTTEEVPVVVMVAHVHRRKDHETLIRAWRLVLDRLAERGETAVLALAGIPGDTWGRCQAAAKRLSVDHAIRFLGEIRDVAGLLSVAEVGVLSSHHEGCPNAILEYMAAGLPVIGTDIPSIREIFDNHDWLVPPEDPRSLADRIMQLLLDEDLRGRLGDRNRRRAAEEFSAECQLRGWKQLVEEIFHDQA